MKTYNGIRTPEGAKVTVSTQNLTSPLRPQASQRLVNHSPDGFEWGYGGSGPSQLALAILLDHTGDKEKALSVYMDFKREVVACMPRNWSLTAAEIDMWLTRPNEGRYFRAKWDGEDKTE